MAIIKPEQLQSGSYSISGSFSGSFQGDGSQLSGIVSSKWSGSNPITRDGNVEITGSLNVTSGITGSLFGVASTASYVLNAVSSSYAGVANSVNDLNQNVFVSGTLTVLGGATIYGSSSFQYITASQLDVSASFISVNVFEPAQRFGGLIVYDSGSSQATASLAWDSLHNHWVYQNVNGATYTGGMFLSGPRNTGSLGDEPNLTKWFIPRGDGGDHLDDSQIFSSGSTHIVTGSLNVTAGVTASFTGSYAGDGNGLYNIPASGIVGLNLSQIASGSVSASISPNNGLQVNTNVTATSFTGSLTGSVVAPGSTTQVVFNDGGILGANSGFVYSGSRVGIGTTTPSTILDVNGNGKFNTTLKVGSSALSAGVTTETEGVFRAWTSLQIGQFGNLTINQTSLSKQSTGADFFEFRNTGTLTPTVGTYYHIQATSSFTPTSGTAIFNGLNLNFIVNQTGGANGITRGLFVNPTLTSAADFRAIETVSGNVLLNTTSGNTGIGLTSTTSRLHVRGSGTTSATTGLRVENTNASASMVVLDNGFVGINTGSAQFNLDVDGTTRSTTYAFRNSGTSTISSIGNSYINFYIRGFRGFDLYNGSSNAEAQKVLIGNFAAFGVETARYASAMLIVESTTKGFLPPRTDLTSNISSPGQGLITYVTASATEGLYYYNSGSYQGWTRTLNDSGSQSISGSLRITGSLAVLGTGSFTTPTRTITIQDFTDGINGTAPTISANGIMRLGVSSNTLWISGQDVLIGNAGSQLTITGDTITPNYNNSGALGTTLKYWGNLYVNTSVTSVKAAIGRTSATASLDVAGTTRISGSFDTAISGTILTVIGSGSAQPLFLVSGSVGELLSVIDQDDPNEPLLVVSGSAGQLLVVENSTTGSLLQIYDSNSNSVFEVNNDAEIVYGVSSSIFATQYNVINVTESYQTIYNIETGSYTGVFINYTLTSGSNATAGQLLSVWNNGTSSFSEITSTDIGDTSQVAFDVTMAGSVARVAISASLTTGWQVKTALNIL